MLKPEPLNGRSASSDSEIEIVDMREPDARDRLAALGAQSLQTAQGELRGHTFHYSRFETSLTPASHTIKHSNHELGEAVYQGGNLRASYFHAYFASNPVATAALFLRR